MQLNFLLPARTGDVTAEVDMTKNCINEPVKVYAVYRQAGGYQHDKLRPVMFVWRNREYRIQDVTYVWRENQGTADIYHFTVSDGASLFELSYNARTFDWRLKSACYE